jgi:hypothetical protein
MSPVFLKSLNIIEEIFGVNEIKAYICRINNRKNIFSSFLHIYFKKYLHIKKKVLTFAMLKVERL